MNVSKIELGQRIKAIRLSTGLNMREFGEKIFNSADSLVSRWEKGKSIPTHKRLIEIAKLGDVTVSYLLYGNIKTFVSNIIDHYFSKTNTFELLDIDEIKEVKINDYSTDKVSMFYEVQKEFIDQYGENNIDTWELKNEADDRLYNYIESDLKDELRELNAYYLDEWLEIPTKFRVLNKRLKENFDNEVILSTVISEAFEKTLLKYNNFDEKEADDFLNVLIKFYSSLYNGKFKHYLYFDNKTTIDTLSNGLLNVTTPNFNVIELFKFDNWNNLSNESQQTIRDETIKYIELLIMRELNK